jgi:hypothetical protein
MHVLISRFKPSRKKVRLFSVYLSAIGIVGGIFLLVRAYLCHKYGLRFTYATEAYTSEKLFQGYESTILMYMSYFLQGIALNSSVIEKYPVTIGKISNFLLVASMVILFPSLWFYCSSAIPELENLRYFLAIILIAIMILNIFLLNSEIKESFLEDPLGDILKSLLQQSAVFYGYSWLFLSFFIILVIAIFSFVEINLW